VPVDPGQRPALDEANDITPIAIVETVPGRSSPDGRCL